MIDRHFLIACTVHCRALILGIEPLGNGDEGLAGDNYKLRMMFV